MSTTIELPVSLPEEELEEVKRDLAVLLYQRHSVSLGMAAKLASLTRIQFQHLLASRRIPLNYSEADLDADRETLRVLRTQSAEP